MSKNQNNKKEGCCPGCGSDKVVLTEERGAPPRCGGCGKSLNK